MADRKGSSDAEGRRLRAQRSQAVSRQLRTSTGPNEVAQQFHDEWQFYTDMGWCSCPECDRVLYTWEEFELHAPKCVYGEQGVRMNNKRFTWQLTS